MIKPKEIVAADDYLVVRGLFRKRHVSLRNLTAIKIEKVLSLSDEIGVTLVGEPTIFFTDAVPWFMDVARALDFETRLGPKWYQRAESGERLEYRNDSATGLSLAVRTT